MRVSELGISAVAMMALGLSANASASFAHTDWTAFSEGLVASSGPYVMETALPAPTVQAWFGASVAMWRDDVSGTYWAVVGAPAEDNFAGAAYVFSLDAGATSWQQQARLTASDASDGSEFGHAVSIDHGTVAVGAPLREADLFVGAAYVFARDEATGHWVQQGDAITETAIEFGFAVAVAGDNLAVSDPAVNTVFTYGRTGSSWSKFVAIPAPLEMLGPNFGVSLAMDESRLLVGAPTDNSVAINQGSAALYALSRDGWDEQQILRPEIDTSAGQLFGQALAMSGGTIVIGAPREHSDAGAVHVFGSDTSSWSERYIVAYPGSAALAFFGSTVGVTDTGLAIGTMGDGVAYLYGLKSGAWTLDSKAHADPGDCFGNAVAAAGDKFLVGANCTGAKSEGAAYVFTNDRIFADGLD